MYYAAQCAEPNGFTAVLGVFIVGGFTYLVCRYCLHLRKSFSIKGLVLRDD